MGPSLLTNQSEKNTKKLGRRHWVLASCQVSPNSVKGFQRSREFEKLMTKDDRPTMSLWGSIKNKQGVIFTQHAAVGVNIRTNVWYCDLFNHRNSHWAESANQNIYTPSVFCYNEHKKNFNIHFSMKKHTWRMSRLLRRLFWIPPCCVFKNGYFIAKRGQFW